MGGSGEEKSPQSLGLTKDLAVFSDPVQTFRILLFSKLLFFDTVAEKATVQFSSEWSWQCGYGSLNSRKKQLFYSREHSSYVHTT